MNGSADAGARTTTLAPLPIRTDHHHAWLLPGEVPDTGWAWPAPAGLHDPDAMANLATRALAAGVGGRTAVGITCLRHGEGATTIARALAGCLAGSFGKRVVLVEANQRSPSMRQAMELPAGPGLADVTAHAVPLGGALQVAGGHRRILVLPAAGTPGASLTAASLRAVLDALLRHADAVVVDLAPIQPYRDTQGLCAALDGIALVMRGGFTRAREAQTAVETMCTSGTAVLGAVLNREKRVVPRRLERWLGR